MVRPSPCACWRRTSSAVAGRLYAVGTLGGIAGTLVTAFWLIPAFGVHSILTGIGALLVATSAFTLPIGRPALIILGVGGGLLALRLLTDDHAPVDTLVFEAKSLEEWNCGRGKIAYVRHSGRLGVRSRLTRPGRELPIDNPISNVRNQDGAVGQGW